jgi:hypothetical protein
MKGIVVRITIITDQDGKILGTARHPVSLSEGQLFIGLNAGPGQTAYEIELPRELEEIESAESLHLALGKHMELLRERG